MHFGAEKHPLKELLIHVIKQVDDTTQHIQAARRVEDLNGTIYTTTNSFTRPARPSQKPGVTTTFIQKKDGKIVGETQEVRNHDGGRWTINQRPGVGGGIWGTPADEI